MRKISLLLLQLFALLGLTVAFAPPALAEAKCYIQNRDGLIQFFPVCDRSLEGYGFPMGTLPNPLNANQCYFWSNADNAQPQIVNCADPRFANAANYIDTPSAAPPASINNVGNSTASDKWAQANKDSLDPNKLAGNANASCDASKPGNNCLVNDVNVFINIMSAGVGVVVIAMFMYGGILYITASGDPQKIAKAKSHVRNAVIALLAFIFLFAFLQWVVPGGLL